MVELIQVTSIDELRKICSESKNPVLIKFSADWCGPCKVLHKDLIQCDKNITVCEVDVNCTAIRSLYTFRSIPYVVRVDKDLSTMGEVAGYSGLEQLFSSLGIE